MLPSAAIASHMASQLPSGPARWLVPIPQGIPWIRNHNLSVAQALSRITYPARINAAAHHPHRKHLQGTRTQPGVNMPTVVPEARCFHLFAARSLTLEDPGVVHAALQTDAVARRILAKALSPVPGELVGVRLNINVLNRTGVAAHSIHRATSLDGHRKGRGFYRGEVISYAPVVVLANAYFNVHQALRDGIAAGTTAKCPMASIDGEYVAPQSVPSFDGVEVRFNPKTTHLFVDTEGYAVKFAQHVTILGHRAFLRGRIDYYSESDAPARAGKAPTEARFR